MSNYNARLDDVLDDFGWTCIANGGDGYGLQNEDVSEAKQALTSLIKELVAEVKPGYDAVKNSERDKAIDEFEQNILKELEGNNENNSISGQAIRI